MSEELYHYGVKGMKWGVRKDEATLIRMTGAKSRSTASDRKTRKQENAAAKKDWEKYKKSTTRAERKADRIKALSSKVDYLVDTAMKNPDGTLVYMNAPGTIGVMTTGKEFLDHISKGGAIDVRYTTLFAEFQKE